MELACELGNADHPPTPPRGRIGARRHGHPNVRAHAHRNARHRRRISTECAGRVHCYSPLARNGCAVSEMLTVPVTRAVDRALRMLQLTYQMLSLHRGCTAAEALRHVAGYTSSGEPTRSAARKFEHDKKGLRSIGIPITVQLVSDPPSSCYKVRARDLLLPTYQVSQTNWQTLRTHSSSLQRVADLLPSLPVTVAAPLTSVLLTYAEELDLNVPSWNIPQAMLGHGPTMLEWVHALLYIVAKRGRATQQWGGAPVSLDSLSARTGLSQNLLWHVAERGIETPTPWAEWSHVVRIVPVSRKDGMGVIAPEMKAPWRPQLSHVDTFIVTAANNGHELHPDCARSLREFARGRTVTQASSPNGAAD